MAPPRVSTKGRAAFIVVACGSTHSLKLGHDHDDHESLKLGQTSPDIGLGTRCAHRESVRYFVEII